MRACSCRALAAVASVVASACGGSTTQTDIAIAPQSTSLIGSASTPVAIHATGVGTVTLTVTGAPTGASAAFDKSQISGSETATLTVNPGTAVGGIYTLAVAAAAGSISRGTSITWTFSTPGCTSDTWQSYAANFFTQNCTACHAGYSTYGPVQAAATKLVSFIGSGNMPPPGSPALAAGDQRRIVTWLGCGLPE